MAARVTEIHEDLMKEEKEQETLIEMG